MNLLPREAQAHNGLFIFDDPLRLWEFRSSQLIRRTLDILGIDG